MPVKKSIIESEGRVFCLQLGYVEKEIVIFETPKGTLNLLGRNLFG